MIDRKIIGKWLIETEFFAGKEPGWQLRDTSSIPGRERSPREGNGNPLQYSCLGNSMDRGDWQATVYGVAKESDMT